jgi:electron transfer flavoprotein beta subunit
MKVAVCVKEVPDTEARLRVAKDGRWIDEEDLRYVRNESDSYAVEEALAVAEKTDGEVVVVGLGPARIAETLRKTLAMGPDRAIHLVDDAYQGGDAHATARALAAAIAAEGVDLVITGSQSDDVGYGSTGSMIAGHLGWPHAWLVMGLEVEEGGKTAKVVREMESGMNEVLRLSLPAVIEVQAGLNHPRYASLKGIMKAKRKPVANPTPADLGLSADEVGAAGSRLEIVDVSFPDSGAGAQILEGDAATAVKTLVDKLQKEARVL